MSRVSYVKFPTIPRSWSPVDWTEWATLMVAAVTTQFNVLRQDAQIKAEPFQPPTATVAQLTADAPALYRPEPDGKLVYCVDAAGGGVMVYSRAGLWRRFDTNAIVT